MHQRFVHAVNILGVDKAVPTKIMEIMHMPGVTRENVGSHLQKFRIYLKRVQNHSATGSGPPPPQWVRAGVGATPAAGVPGLSLDASPRLGSSSSPDAAAAFASRSSDLPRELPSCPDGALGPHHMHGYGAGQESITVRNSSSGLGGFQTPHFGQHGHPLLQVSENSLQQSLMLRCTETRALDDGVGSWTHAGASLQELQMQTQAEATAPVLGETPQHIALPEEAATALDDVDDVDVLQLLDPATTSEGLDSLMPEELLSLLLNADPNSSKVAL